MVNVINIRWLTFWKMHWFTFTVLNDHRINIECIILMIGWSKMESIKTNYCVVSFNETHTSRLYNASIPRVSLKETTFSHITSFWKLESYRSFQMALYAESIYIVYMIRQRLYSHGRQSMWSYNIRDLHVSSRVHLAWSTDKSRSTDNVL